MISRGLDPVGTWLERVAIVGIEGGHSRGRHFEGGRGGGSRGRGIVDADFTRGLLATGHFLRRRNLLTLLGSYRACAIAARIAAIVSREEAANTIAQARLAAIVAGGCRAAIVIALEEPAPAAAIRRSLVAALRSPMALRCGTGIAVVAASVEQAVQSASPFTT
jgi:hypothetical protein